jgi:hypothetical protein
VCQAGDYADVPKGDCVYAVTQDQLDGGRADRGIVIQCSSTTAPGHFLVSSLAQICRALEGSAPDQASVLEAA